MFQSLRLLRVLDGVRHFVPKQLKVVEHAAPQNEGVLDRLLSRAELELSSPDGVRRRETIAQLKIAAAASEKIAP